MEPIINPWLVYLIGGVCSVQMFLGVFGGLSGIVGMLLAMFSRDEYDDKVAAKMQQWAKRLIVVAVTFGLLLALIPSQSTIIAMIVADNITENNLQAAGGIAQDIRSAVKGDILEIIEAVKEVE